MLIQYQEQGIFYDYIRRNELQAHLLYRIKELENLIQYGSRLELANSLRIYPGTHTKESLVHHAKDRLASLHVRLCNLNNIKE